MNEEKEYSPETNDALINAIPKKPYDPCPCGCGKKWRFVVREGETEIIKHLTKFCDDYERKIK